MQFISLFVVVHTALLFHGCIQSSADHEQAQPAKEEGEAKDSSLPKDLSKKKRRDSSRVQSTQKRSRKKGSRKKGSIQPSSIPPKAAEEGPDTVFDESAVMAKIEARLKEDAVLGFLREEAEVLVKTNTLKSMKILHANKRKLDIDGILEIERFSLFDRKSEYKTLFDLDRFWEFAEQVMKENHIDIEIPKEKLLYLTKTEIKERQDTTAINDPLISTEDLKKAIVQVCTKYSATYIGGLRSKMREEGGREEGKTEGTSRRTRSASWVPLSVVLFQSPHPSPLRRVRSLLRKEGRMRVELGSISFPRPIA